MLPRNRPAAVHLHIIARRNLVRQLTCLMMIALLAPFLQETGGNSKPTASLSREIGPFHVEQFGAYHALAEISQKAGVGIGVDAIQPSEEATISFDFPGGTVSDLLNLFSSQVPEYEWHQGASSFIHMSRRGAHVSLLDVRLDYAGVHDMSRKDFWEGVSKVPEIAAWLDSNHCSRDQFTQGGEFKTYNGPISINSGTLT